MMFQAVLFDLDGVLIDSEESYTRFWAGIERDFPTGIPDYPLAIKGTTLSAILQRYPEGHVRSSIVERIHAFEQVIRYGVYPGVYAFLAELKAAGVKTAIVTSSDDVKMRALFGQVPELEGWFDVIVDGSMITCSKPHPEPYLTAAAMLGVDPGECVVMEDSFQGVASGLAAGCRTVGVATTFPADALKAKGAETVIHSFDALTPAALEQLLSKP